MSPASKQNDLSGIVKVGVVVVVVSLGVWGCARKPADNTVSTERVRGLERRCVTLEQNYRAVQEARDKVKRELSAQEEESARLQKELVAAAAVLKERDELRKQVKTTQAEREAVRQVLLQRTNERDDLRQQLSARSGERDVLQSRCERLRKGLQSVLSQDDMPFGASPVSAPAASAGPPAGQS